MLRQCAQAQRVACGAPRRSRSCSRRPAPARATAAAPAAPESAAARDAAKAALFRLLDGTGRGLTASYATRVRIAEAQLGLEAFGGELDLDLLAGTWRLEYTTAADVLVLLEAERRTFGLITFGDIYQRFDAWGNIENVIRVAAPLLAPAAPLRSGPDAPAGATLRVAARYARAGGRTLRLWFDSASLGELRVSDALEALLAPAILPRTPPQMLLLQALRDAKLTVPLPGLGVPSEDDGPTLSGRRGAPVGSYLLSYCDGDTLVGRAQGGVYIFRREGLPGASGAA